MALAAFKTEIDAVATPPLFFFSPTLENFAEVRSRADYPVFAMNSIVISASATLVAIILALPAAFAMAFHPSKRTKDLLLWMLSTKMMPAIGVLIPIYLVFQRASPARHDLRPDHHICPHEPADCRLDDLFLLPRRAEGDSRGGAHGRRQAVGSK